ncbi:MAG: site-specific DNA-methyltransferase [Nitrospirae bacterium]|nr:site-specific DNA-methyltransferase [Nitrospirota bacterium]
MNAAMSVSPLYQEVGVALNEIETLSAQLECRYDGRLKTEVALSRGLVSFQANKSRAVYRWYKFKEAFSADLVEYFLDRFRLSGGVMLDPFAGSGTALFVSRNMGLSAVGVELLPIGQRIIETKKLIDEGLTPDELKMLEKWSNSTPWHQSKGRKPIAELRITKDAYPTEAISSMEKFLYSIYEESPRVASVLLFALLCTLEAISFTRKDGQYLRWDHRTQRRLKGNIPFNKGEILSFDEAMSKKLKDIVADLAGAGQPTDLFRKEFKRGDVTLHAGSCLEILPKLPGAHFDCVITSPPYCNRYDYTRTYALELALLGVNEMRLSELRQEMLSCTVENRGKDLLGMNPDWKSAISVTDKHELLQSVLMYLNGQKESGALNNNGIPRMVRGYFYEMACVIYECSRVLKSGAPLIMVNDNVRYAGASIPVDLILSDIAAELGFNVDKILVLPNGKGNSSQQMGAHGRDLLRKCVYVWRKK